MANDQQFCLRWNNHQTTLVEIFDKLLSNERLVDCTLAAEGQYLRAHKVLLSACSPYFELILSQHNDKHPIIILKDVTFRELKALMDYMYRGEVNVSQDQLGALLKVAENLQIKGLSDSGGGGTEPKEKPPEKRPLPPPPPAQQPTPIIPRPGLTIEHRRSNQLDLSTHSPSALDGSPVPRKRKRTRRRSSDDESSLGHTPIESHHDSSSRESSSLSIPPNVASTPLSKSVAVIPEPPPVLDRTDHILPEPAQPIHHDIVHKTEPNTEMLLEPKHEYPDDDMNEDSVEDLTLEDDMNDLDQSQAGPSGEGSSSQGFTPWHMATDRSTDEVFMQAQEAVGAQRDSQGGDNLRSSERSVFERRAHSSLQCQSCSKVFKRSTLYNRHILLGCGKTLHCPTCKKHYTLNSHLLQHIKYECGKELKCSNCNRVYASKPGLDSHRRYECGKEPRLQCPFCPHRSKYKHHLETHIRSIHV